MVDRRTIWISFGSVGPEHYLDHAKTAAEAAERVLEFALPPIEWTRWLPDEAGRTGLEIHPQFTGDKHVRLWHGDPEGNRPDAPLGPGEKRSFEERFLEMMKIYSENPPAWRRLWHFPGRFPEGI